MKALEVKRQESFTYPSTYYGRIEPARSAALSFELAGRLSEVLVDEGGEIGEQEVIARLDTTALEADRQVLLTRRKVESTLLDRLERGEREEVIAVARAEVKRSEVNLRQKEGDRIRAENVYKGRAISKADYDQAVYAHEAAKFSLEQAKKRLEELETGSRIEDVQAQASRVAEIDAQLQRLDVQFEKSELRTPFPAVCVRRHLDEGVTVSPGQTVLEINEADRLEARFSVPQREIDQISEDCFLEVEGERFAIQDVRVISQVDQSIRAVDIVIPILAKAERQVLPGQSCSLQINRCVTADCVKLPITALVPSIRGLWSCYRLAPNDQDAGSYVIEKVEVSILHTDGVDVVVTSAIPDGSLVIPRGAHRLVPGMRVRVAETES